MRGRCKGIPSPAKTSYGFCAANSVAYVEHTEVSSGKGKSFKLGRDSRNGQFVTVREARNRPGSTQVEHVPKRGYGDTGRGGKKK